MKLLHLTNSKNLGSITKHGLLPSFIGLDSHWEKFRNYLQQRYCVYLWSAETYKNDKFIRDMVYTKMFIHPRNKIFWQRENELEKNGLDIYDDENYLDFKKFGDKLFGGNSEEYLLLEIDSEDVDLEGSWKHVQEPHDDKYGTITIMDDNYAHNDKEIYISGASINFKNINVVEEVLVNKYKSDKLGFTFRKN